MPGGEDVGAQIFVTTSSNYSRSTTAHPTIPPQLTAGNITLVKPLGEDTGADFINVESIQNNSLVN